MSTHSVREGVLVDFQNLEMNYLAADRKNLTRLDFCDLMDNRAILEEGVIDFLYSISEISKSKVAGSNHIPTIHADMFLSLCDSTNKCPRM